MNGLKVDPHANASITMDGSPLDVAKAAVIMLHGRGSSAEDILALTSHFRGDGVAYLAPEANGNSWYPQWFMSKLNDNQPNLDSALRLLKNLVKQLELTGIPPRRILILGFSQGACLASEFAIRNAQRFGGFAALSGGLMGPEGTVWDYPGSLDDTPIYLGCSDVDPFIPLQRVYETGEVLGENGGQVTLKIFSEMGHFVNQEELQTISRMIDSMV